MTQQGDIFERRIAAVQERISALLGRAGTSPELRKEAAEVLETLSTGLEELQVVGEELRQQNEELVGARQTLERERRRYQELFELAPDGYLVTDTQGVIGEANRAAETLLQVPLDRLVGKPLVIYVSQDQRQDFTALLARLNEGERAEDWEVHLQPRRGESFPAAIRVAGAYDVAGRLVGFRWLLRDIKQHIQVQEALWASEKEFRAMFELNVVGMAQVDPDSGRFVRVNRKLCEISGYAEQELLGMTFSQLTHPDDRAADVALYQAALRGESDGWTSQKRYIRQDGACIWVEVVGTIIYNASGRPYRSIAVIRDITQRKEVEEALHKSEQKLRSFVEQSPDAIALMDEGGHVVEWNPAAEEMLGLKQADVLGQPIWDVQFEVAPDEQKGPVAYEQLKSAVLTMLQTGRMPDAGPLLKRDIQRPDGVQRTIQSLVFPIQTEGGFMLGSMTRDVTERRREQQERERLLAQVMRNQESIAELAASLERERDTLQTIMENTHAQLAYLDPDFNFIRVNSAYAQSSGHSQEELIGHNHFELFPNAENQAIFEGVRDTGQAVHFQARPFEYADQPERGVTYWDWSLVPVKDESRGVQGLVLSLTEVTDRIRAEQEREQHRARVDRLIGISQALLAESTANGVLQLVVDGARELTGARLSRAGYNYQAGVFQAGAVSGVEDLSPSLTKEIFGPTHTSVYLDLIREETSIRLTDAQLRAHPALRGRPEGHRLMRGLLGARLIDRDGQADGLICVSGKEEGDFTREDQALLVQLAALCSLALQHIEAREAVIRWVAELDATIAAIPDGVEVYGPTGEIVRINQAAIRMLGSSAIGRGLAWDEWMRLLHIETAEGRPVSDLAELPSRRALRGETVSKEVMAMRHPDSGERVWLSVSAAPILSPDEELLGAVVSLADISELRRARDELELRVQERTAELVAANQALEYQAYLLANVNDAIIATDEHGRITAWNRAAEDMFGWTAADALGRLWTEFLTMARADIDPASMVRGLARHGRWRGEIRFYHRDGAAAVSEINIMALKDEAGQSTGFVTVSRDVTENRRAQEALRESEGRFRQLAENIEQVFWMWDPDRTEIFYVGPAYEAIWGHSCQSLYQKPRSFVEAIHPADRRRVLTHYQRHKRAGYEVDYRVVRPDGSIRWVRDRAFPIRNDEGQVYRMAGITEDITLRKQAEDALRESEAAYRTLAENLPGIVYRVFIREGNRTQFFNKVAETVTGYASEQLDSGTVCSIDTLILPEDRPGVIAEVERAISEDRPFSVEYRLRHKDGRIRYLLEQGTPIRGPDGEPLYIDGVISDITDRVEAEEELKVRGRQQAALTELAQQALTETDLSTVMNLAVAKVADVLGVEYCKVLELLPDGQAFLLRAGVGWRAGLVGQVTIEAGSDTQVGYTLAQGKPVVVEDLRSETRFTGAALLTDHGVISGVSLIIHGQEQPFGVLGAHTSTRRTFSEDEVYFLQTVAHILATAVQRKRAEEAVQQYVLRLEVMRKIDQAILAARSPEEIAEATLRYIRRLSVPCQFASVALFDFESGEVLRLASEVDDGTDLLAGEHLSLDLLGDITPLQQGRPVIENDLQGLPGRSPIQERLLAAGLRSYMGVPLLFQDELIGSLNLAASSAHAFSLEHAEIVRHVTAPLAIAIQNARLFDQVRAGRERLQVLSQRLVEAQEAERRRVSAELHDEAGQALTALKISLELMQSDLPPGSEAVRQSIREAMLLTEQTMEQLRLLARGLRPPALDAVGLNSTLEDYCRDFARVTRLAVDYSGAELPALPDAAMITLYRVVQEGLTNVARHARASRVWVTLRQDANQVSLSVEDDGQGFDREAAEPAADYAWGIGLLGMQERLELLGGRLEVTSRPGRGTRLVARIPWRELL
jgi:PAS domain S-box-containing protein